MVWLALQKIRHSLREPPELFGRFDAVQRVGELARRCAREPVPGALDNRRPFRRVADAVRIGRIGKQRANARVYAAVFGQLAVRGLVGHDGEQALDTRPARRDLVGDSAIRVRARAACAPSLLRGRAHHAQRPRQRRIRHGWNRVSGPSDHGLRRCEFQRCDDRRRHFSQVVAPRLLERLRVASEDHLAGAPDDVVAQPLQIHDAERVERLRDRHERLEIDRGHRDRRALCRSTGVVLGEKRDGFLREQQPLRVDRGAPPRNVGSPWESPRFPASAADIARRASGEVARPPDVHRAECRR